jgi:hypothetical protein
MGEKACAQQSVERSTRRTRPSSAARVAAPITALRDGRAVPLGDAKIELRLEPRKKHLRDRSDLVIAYTRDADEMGR